MEHSQHSKHTPGSPLDRFKAAVVDNVYVGIFNVMLTIILLQFPIPPVVITVITLVIYLCYAVYLTVNKGQTFGKAAFGLKVVQYHTDKHITYTHALLREVLKNGAALIPYIGIFYYGVNGLTVIFSKEKRGFHDMAAKSQVLKTSEHWGAGKQFVYIMIPLVILAILVMHLYTRPEFMRLSGAVQ